MGIRIATFALTFFLKLCSTHGAALPCGGTLSESKGEFFSPNYPDVYPNKAQCTWTIKSTGNQIIELNFPFMDVEYVNWDADCRLDAVVVYNGLEADQRVLARLCGNQTFPLRSTRNEMTVVFTSDSSFQFKGFHATYAFIDVPSLPDYPAKDTASSITGTAESGPCGGELTESSGMFSSPNYPNNYPSQAHCTWSIKSTGNRIIELTLPEVKLEPDWLRDCRFDSVSVYDGPASDKRLLGKLCHNHTGKYTSTRNELTVVFSSDSSTTLSGFKAEYKFLDVPGLKEYPTQAPTQDPAVMSKCGGVHMDAEGEFFSPNYPDVYPNNAHCTWTIKSTGNHIIELNFPFMDVEYVNWDANCRFDAVSVYDGPLVDDHRLTRQCGKNNFTISSTKDEMTVVFTSDSTFPFKGFHAKYRIVDKP